MEEFDVSLHGKVIKIPKHKLIFTGSLYAIKWGVLISTII